MKAWIAAVLAACLCAACAQGGGGSSGSVTMYGTIDTGVTVRK
jgi:predicted porin